MLSIRNLYKRFGGVKAVNDCSFAVPKEKITALIGPNGAGKTTVFNLVSGVLKADAGEILLDGEKITNRSPEEIANFGIARLFQQSHLFENLTVQENLLLALDNQDTEFVKNLAGKNPVSSEKKEKALEMLRFISLEHFLHRTSREMSFGQKRLVELGRTILKPHKLIMLDEPLAGINPKLRIEIGKILEQLREKKETILLIEHDMNFTLQIADHVIVMDEGKVIAQGKPKEIRNNEKVLEAYLGE